MKTHLVNLLIDLKSGSKKFINVIEFIEEHYNCKPSGFKNGSIYNKATENQGSAKVLSFAKINNFSKSDTLLLFAEHYNAVINNPSGTDHQNIRQFMANGWEGVEFDNEVLTAKAD
jgi:hypothetical protein